MRERYDDGRGDGAAALLGDAPVTCQVCGAVQDAPEDVLCAACGEPVLRWGWVP